MTHDAHKTESAPSSDRNAVDGPRLKRGGVGRGSEAGVGARARAGAKNMPAVAYGVLGVGIVLCLVVAGLLVQKFSGSAVSPMADNASVVTPNNGADSAAGAGAGMGAGSSARPVQAGDVKQEMPAMATRDLRDAVVRGDWVVDFQDYYALFQVREGSYQILVGRDQPWKPHYYSRGVYTLDKDMMILSPRDEMGAPVQAGVAYQPIVLRDVHVKMLVDDGVMVWEPGVTDPNFPYQDPAHPLIRYAGQEFLVLRRAD